MPSNNNSKFKAPLPKGSRGRSVKKRGERRPAEKDRSRSRSQQRLEGPRGRGITRDAPGRKGDKSRSRSRAREEQSNPAPASRPTTPTPAPRSRPTTPTAAPASRPRMPTPPLPPSKPVPAPGPSKQAPAPGPSKQAPAPRSAMNIVIDEKSHKTRKEKDAHIAELQKVTEIKLKAAKEAEKREAAEAERREQAMKSKFGQGAYKAITNAEWRGLVAEEQDPIRKGLNPNEIARRQDEEQRENPKRILSAKLKDKELKRKLRRPVQSNKPTPAVRVAKEHEITRAAEAARIQAELNSRVYDEPSNNSKKIGMLKRMFPGKGSKKKKRNDSNKKKK